MVQLRVAVVLTAVLSGLAAATIAAPSKRVALIIGNAAYQHTSPLGNPRNDASDISAALKHHGFLVTEGFDLDKAAMDQKIREFAETIQGASIAAFFYAGHGLQVGGQNYLVPIDAKLTTAAALDFETVRLDLVHRTMERETATNILFVDACRNNPLARNLMRAMGTRSALIGRGLAQVEAGVGTLVSFSTQPGNVALDGTGRNSPFAEALVKHVLASRSDLSDILIAVRNDVLKATKGKQVPWEHSALTGKFYFDADRPAAGAGQADPATLSAAERAWEEAKQSTDIDVLKAFVARYPDSFYRALARARIAEIERNRATAAPLPDATFGGANFPAPATNASWRIDVKAQDCRSSGWTLNLTIAGGKITGHLRTSVVTGTASETGQIQFSYPNVKKGGPHVHYRGELKGSEGHGRFRAAWGNCHGTFTATLQ